MVTVDKLDIKQVLGAVDNRDFEWINTLSDEDKKKLSVWQIMRFVSSCDSSNKEITRHYLQMTNDIVNTHFNSLRLHPELQFRLLQVCGIGSKQYHAWIPPSKKEKSNKVKNWLESQFPEYNDDEIDLLFKNNTTNELKSFAMEKGLQDKEILDIFGK